MSGKRCYYETLEVERSADDSGLKSAFRIERARASDMRKRGFEPLRSCERQPLKPKAVNVDRSRPRKIGVGCPPSYSFEVF